MASVSKSNIVVALMLSLLTFASGQKYPTYKEMEQLIGDHSDFNLWLVGTYLAAHKYYGVDYRYQAGDITPEDRVFYRKFPSPPLKELHPDLEQVCSENHEQCILKIRDVARLSGTLQHLQKESTELGWDVPDPLFAPFDNSYDMFRFRQTASYYMCFYTLNGRISYKNNKVKCLQHLNIVEDAPRSLRDLSLKHQRPMIVDIRDTTFNKDPTLCPKLWFCPDPCYGRMNAGNFVADDFKVKGNPCLDLKNSECNWDNTTVSFDDVKKNKFPIVCDCKSSQKGFHWNNQFQMCVDTDECYEKRFDCPKDRVCMNSVGSYICTCPKGYDVDEKTDSCTRTNLIHEAAVVLEANPALFLKPEAGKPKKETVDLMSELLLFFGASGSTPLSRSYVMLCLTIFLVTRLVREYVN
ncbi:hypothetical protein DPMN_175388 [Dreissena polymorpha]|uniref:EGF-like domain-containing protein n=1 Tax=Dreissena polymorpha TaxID=45954 RepID=A0A9D4E997_DREPO|nr:hypothetical protein DPMN_175388 [Dreissena polymorpha]